MIFCKGQGIEGNILIGGFLNVNNCVVLKILIYGFKGIFIKCGYFKGVL